MHYIKTRCWEHGMCRLPLQTRPTRTETRKILREYAIVVKFKFQPSTAFNGIQNPILLLLPVVETSRCVAIILLLFFCYYG